MEGQRVRAWCNVNAGRAVIVDAQEHRFLLERNNDGTFEGPYLMPEGLHLATWLQPADSVVVENPGEIPDLMPLRMLMCT